eukprot:9383187-Pyramimonas_sp.AAC.1
MFCESPLSLEIVLHDAWQRAGPLEKFGLMFCDRPSHAQMSRVARSRGRHARTYRTSCGAC